MKKLSLLMLLATLTVFVACNKDDDKKPSIEIDGEIYTTGVGYWDNWGGTYWSTGTREEGIATHQEYGLYVTDGVYDGQSWWNEYSFIVGLVLNDPGAVEADLTPGTYAIDTYDNWYYSQQDLSAVKLGRLNLFLLDDERSFYPSGEVTISGTVDNMTIVYDLTIDYYNPCQLCKVDGSTPPDGSFTVSGTFKGSFERVVID